MATSTPPGQPVPVTRRRTVAMSRTGELPRSRCSPRKLRGDPDRLLHIGGFDEVEAPQHFLRLREGTIHRGHPAASNPHRFRHGGVLEHLRLDQVSILAELVRVREAVAHHRVGPARGQRLVEGGVIVDQQHEFHLDTSSIALRTTPDAHRAEALLEKRDGPGPGVLRGRQVGLLLGFVPRGLGIVLLAQKAMDRALVIHRRVVLPSAFIIESSAGIAAAMRASLDPLSSITGMRIFASESATSVAGTAGWVAVA
jgi:hypothetical protein